MLMIPRYTIFILELEFNKYYVGKSYDKIKNTVDKTLMNRNDENWTKLYKPYRIDRMYYT